MNCFDDRESPLCRSARRDQFELNVVRIAKHEHRVPALVIDWRVGYAKLLEVICPGIEIATTCDAETRVIEPSASHCTLECASRSPATVIEHSLTVLEAAAGSTGSASRRARRDRL